MLKIRGNNVWPSAVDAAVFAHREVAEYVGHVFTDADGKTECEVRVALTDQAAATLPPDCSQLLSAVRVAIKERTNVWMTVVTVPRSELPEFTYKARRWKDQRQQGYRL
jgi:phenylacetate-CoA ligase